MQKGPPDLREGIWPLDKSNTYQSWRCAAMPILMSLLYRLRLQPIFRKTLTSQRNRGSYRSLLSRLAGTLRPTHQGLVEPFGGCRSLNKIVPVPLVPEPLPTDPQPGAGACLGTLYEDGQRPRVEKVADTKLRRRFQQHTQNPARNAPGKAQFGDAAEIIIQRPKNATRSLSGATARSSTLKRCRGFWYPLNGLNALFTEGRKWTPECP